MSRHIVFYWIIAILIISANSEAQSQESSCSCCTANHRMFDFWLGNWKVYTPDNQLAGTNSIQVLQDSCLLVENWKSARGEFTGTSYNFYDPADDTWNQVWVDNQSSNLRLKGSRKENQMMMDDSAFADPGQPVNRITWTANNDGTVRQLWELVVSSDSTAVLFDGIYRKN